MKVNLHRHTFSIVDAPGGRTEVALVDRAGGVVNGEDWDLNNPVILDKFDQGELTTQLKLKNVQSKDLYTALKLLNDVATLQEQVHGKPTRMRLTKQRLRVMIKEELSRVLNENPKGAR